MVHREWIAWQKETRVVPQDFLFHVPILRSKRCIPMERAPHGQGLKGDARITMSCLLVPSAQFCREGDRETTTNVDPNYLSWLLVIVIGRRANG